MLIAKTVKLLFLFLISGFFLTGSNPQDKNTTVIHSASSPGARVRIDWLADTVALNRLKSEFPDRKMLDWINTYANFGELEVKCRYTFREKEKTSILWSKQNTVKQPFSPGGKWVVLQLGSTDHGLGIIQTGKLRALLKGLEKAYYRIEPVENGTHRFVYFEEWINGDLFVYHWICCGYTQLVWVDLKRKTGTELASWYGDRYAWNYSTGGKRIAIGRGRKDEKRIDIVPVKQLPGYLRNGEPVEGSLAFTGNFRKILWRSDNDLVITALDKKRKTLKFRWRTR